MKKLLRILVLGLLLSGNAYAEVYYCIEQDATGFHSDTDDVKTYNIRTFNTKKFKAMIDFDKGTFQAKDIEPGANFSCKKISSQKYSMSCMNNFGHIFTIAGDIPTIDYFNFTRATTYGRGDSLLIAYGNCEKF